MNLGPRIGIFGWGIVAPRSPNVDAFARNLLSAESWLTPFEGFGPSNFMAGEPEFDFSLYKPWFDARFPSNRFNLLDSKMGMMTKYALGAFIQSLEQNPGIEATLRELGREAHVYLGTGLSDVPTISRQAILFERAVGLWNRFWAASERSAARREFEALPPEERQRRHAGGEPPADPAGFEIGSDEWLDARAAWETHWTRASDGLAAYLAEARAIQSIPVGGEVESGKASVIRRKLTQIKALNKKWGCPTEPWSSVSSNLIWNIANGPAAQVSINGRITGESFAPVGACSSFGLGLSLAIQAIRAGRAKAVVVGMTDSAPHPLVVGAFYAGNVISADGQVSVPLTDLKGTHISGGACVWIVADADFMRQRGYRTLGMEIVSVGVTSDADHIITPSKEGSRLAIYDALEQAGIGPADIGTWDLHATATPGDYMEVENLLEVMPRDMLLTARKGTFGHGMAACGGWELTAQHLGVAAGSIQPTPLAESRLNAQIRNLGARFVFDTACGAAPRYAGKMSMGIGGINACVISRAWPE